MKRFIYILSIVSIIGLVNCGGGSSSKEAKELLQKILQVVGIPHNIVANICQDANKNGLCEATELQTKVTLNKGDSFNDILQKISLTDDGKYFLETMDATLPILLVLQDTQNIHYDNGEFTLPFSGFKNNEEDTVKELSILASMVDNDSLREDDIKNIRNLDNQSVQDQYYNRLLRDLENNINKLKEKDLTSSDTMRESLKYMSRELLNNDIKTRIPQELNNCGSDSSCVDNILNPLYEDLLITDEEAEEIKHKMTIPTTIQGSIKDASIEDKAIADASVKLYNSNKELIKEEKTNSMGKYKFENIPYSSNYYLIISKDGYLDVEYHNIEVLEHEIKYLETVLQINQQYIGKGTISGTINNAINGEGVSGLTISFRKGFGNKNGEIIATTITQDNGYFEISELEAGNYTGEMSAEGYQKSYITVVVLGNEVKNNQNSTINPLLEKGEIRIMLTWGDSPSDLDSHLTGPTESNDRFHIYFGNKGSIESSPFVNLDWDDTDQYGPETITIRKKINGVYRYSVHNFSEESSLANSNAIVRVFNDKGLVFEANVPNKEGNIWTVFTIEGHEIIPVNNMKVLDSENYENSFKLSKTSKLNLK